MSTNGVVEVLNALPISKLISTVSAGIGKMYEPHHKRKMADATAYEINVIGEAMRNAADLPIVYNENGVVINSEDFTRLMQRAGTRMVLQETIKQHNIERVVDNAYDILENEETCSEDPVEQGWINRFFDSVADISDEDLQKLWGKVLAGEIKQPKSYSLRALETLKNLSKNEAELFQHIAPYIISTNDLSFLSNNTEIKKQFNILDGDYIQLASCGLLQMIPFTEINTSVLPHKTQRNFLTETRLLSITNNTSSEQNLKIKEIYLLTSAGKELFNLLAFIPNNEYFEKWVRITHRSNNELLFTVHEKAENKTKEYKVNPLISLGE